MCTDANHNTKKKNPEGVTTPGDNTEGFSQSRALLTPAVCCLKIDGRTDDGLIYSTEKLGNSFVVVVVT